MNILFQHNIKQAGLLRYLLCLLLVSCGIALLSHGTAPAIPMTPGEPFFQVINPGDETGKKFLQNWSPLTDRKRLIHWAKSSGMHLSSDDGLVVDGKAQFVMPFGSKIHIRDLDRNTHYWIWLDFVVFKYPEGKAPDSRLEVFADDKKVISLKYSNLKAHRNPLRIDIPYEVIQDSEVVLYFRENARNTGYWGLWDCIISDSYSLPEKLPNKGRPINKKELPVKEKILERKGTIKKTVQGKEHLKKPMPIKQKEKMQEKSVKPMKKKKTTAGPDKANGKKIKMPEKKSKKDKIEMKQSNHGKKIEAPKEPKKDKMEKKADLKDSEKNGEMSHKKKEVKTGIPDKKSGTNAPKEAKEPEVKIKEPVLPENPKEPKNPVLK